MVELRRAILAEAGDDGLTRKQVWDALPDDLRRNETRVNAVIEDGVEAEWRKEERSARSGGAVYHLLIN